MRPLTATMLAISLLILMSCQHTPAQWQLKKPQDLLVDQAYFQGELHAVQTADEIFRLPQANKQELSQLKLERKDIAEYSTAILAYIQAYTNGALAYNQTKTRAVSETLATGEANCLSLSILAYSIAKEVGLEPVFQDVAIPEYWSSGINQIWLSGHINLKILQNRQLNYGSGMVLLGNDIVIDFDSITLKQRFTTKKISPQRVLAMFYNNKAAEYFDRGNFAQTYRYYLAAIKADPDYPATWSNLAVLYRQHHRYSLAEHAYHHSLALNPKAINTLANLAMLYRYMGNENKAVRLEQQVHEKRKANPWYYVMLGNEALKFNNPEKAIKLFRHSLSLNISMHEAYFGLAKSYFALNNTHKAAYYLSKSRRAALSNEDKERYQHKIDTLDRLASAG